MIWTQMTMVPCMILCLRFFIADRQCDAKVFRFIFDTRLLRVRGSKRYLRFGTVSLHLGEKWGGIRQVAYKLGLGSFMNNIRTISAYLHFLPLCPFLSVMPKIPYKQGYKDFISLGSSSLLSIHSKKCIHNVRMCHIEGLLRLKASPHTPSYLSVCPYYSQPYGLESQNGNLLVDVRFLNSIQSGLEFSLGTNYEEKPEICWQNHGYTNKHYHFRILHVPFSTVVSY